MNKKQLLNSFVAAVIFFLISDYSFNLYVYNTSFEDYYNFSPRDEITYKLMNCKEVFKNNSEKYKILMVGDSRPESAFNPRYLDSLFNETTISYNLAISGIGLPIQDVLFEIFLKETQPDLILWELNDGDFSLSGNEMDAFFNSPGGRYYNNGFYGTSKTTMTDSLLLKFSSFYRFRSILKPNWISPREDRKGIIAQFSPAFGASRGQHVNHNIDFNVTDNIIYNVTRDYPTYPNYPGSESAYKNIINLFREKSQQFFVIYGPFNNETAFCNLYAPLVEAQFNTTLRGNELISFMGRTEFANASLYFNYNHLNYDGSLIYTQLIYDKIHGNLTI